MTIIDTDTLILEKVEIYGPPPPARLDHAMCTVHLPTTTVTTTNDHRLKESDLPTPPSTIEGVHNSMNLKPTCTCMCNINLPVENLASFIGKFFPLCLRLRACKGCNNLCCLDKR